MKQNILVLLLVALMLSTLAACGTQTTASRLNHQTVKTEPNTGDASLDNPRNQNNIGKKELLVVSFGTSFNDSRRQSIGAIESAMEKAFPDFSVRRAFTSQTIIEHIKDRDGVTIDNVKEALDRAVNNGVTTLVVQPTHLIDGLEYQELVQELVNYSDAFDKLAIGAPILTSEQDCNIVIQSITEDTSQYNDGKTAICFMGHGTEAKSNEIYATLQTMLTEAGHDHYFIGTAEAAPTLDDVLSTVNTGSYTRVVLQPLMIVAGDHVTNDMASDEDSSWKHTFEAAGYDVTCLLKGMGEMESIQQLLVQHAAQAMKNKSIIIS